MIMPAITTPRDTKASAIKCRYAPFTLMAFSEFGFMTEKIFKKFSIYVNFENFTDTRQGKYKRVVNGTHLTPTFDEIWTHTEGFVFNGGIKLKL